MSEWRPGEPTQSRLGVTVLRVKGIGEVGEYLYWIREGEVHVEIGGTLRFVVRSTQENGVLCDTETRLPAGTWKSVEVIA